MPAACLNCGTALTGPFCSSCGSIPGTLVKFVGVAAVYWTFVILATLGLLGYTFATL